MTKRRGTGGKVLLALVLIGVWYLLSGKFDVLHFGSGVVAALVIAATLRRVEDGTDFRVGRFLVFLPWLIGQIVLSNLRVARMVLMRRMPIAPVFIRMAPGVEGPRALTLLGVSITLTPGTLTLDVDRGELFVHALDAASAHDIREQVMARRVGAVFLGRTAP